MFILGNEVKISLGASPNAGRNEMVGFTDGVLRLKVSAPLINILASVYAS